ncbi:DUF1080 domain-containing protein [Planctomycetota bacterium]
MSKRFGIFITWLVVLLSAIACGQQTDATEPWETLFNGKDFTGWKIIGSKGKAWVEDEAFVCHQVCNTPEHTFICTENKYSDFILEAEAKIEGPLHTGFLLRCVDANEDNAKVAIYGYQVKIDPTERRWTGGVFDDFGKSWNWFYPLKESEKARSAFTLNEWNRFRMEAIGDSIKVWVNDIPTCNLVHNKYRKGTIAIKIHSMGNKPEMEKVLMRYRNIRIITENPEKYRKAMDYPVIDLIKQKTPQEDK